MVITRLALVLGFHQIITDVSRLGDGQTGSEWDGDVEFHAECIDISRNGRMITAIFRKVDHCKTARRNQSVDVCR